MFVGEELQCFIGVSTFRVRVLVGRSVVVVLLLGAHLRRMYIVLQAWVCQCLNFQRGIGVTTFGTSSSSSNR